MAWIVVSVGCNEFAVGIYRDEVSSDRKASDLDLFYRRTRISLVVQAAGGDGDCSVPLLLPRVALDGGVSVVDSLLESPCQ